MYRRKFTAYIFMFCWFEKSSFDAACVWVANGRIYVGASMRRWKCGYHLLIWLVDFSAQRVFLRIAPTVLTFKLRMVKAHSYFILIYYNDSNSELMLSSFQLSDIGYILLVALNGRYVYNISIVQMIVEDVIINTSRWSSSCLLLPLSLWWTARHQCHRYNKWN